MITLAITGVSIALILTNNTSAGTSLFIIGMIVVWCV